MPVETLNPSSIGTDDAWNLAAGGSKVAAVSPPDDETTSYIQIVTQGARQSFNMDPAPTDFAAVNTLKVKWRARYSSGSAAQHNPFVELSASYTDDTNVVPTTAFQDFTSADLAKPGGGAWDKVSLDAADFGVRYNQVANANCDVTTLVVELDYIQSAGGWISLIGQFVAGAVGSGIILEQVPELVKLIPNLRVKPAEYVEFLEALRGMRYPRYAFLGA